MKISVLDDGKDYEILEYVGVIVGRRLEKEEEIIRLVYRSSRSCDTA